MTKTPSQDDEKKNKDRRVQIGSAKGETPRKLTFFNRLDEPSKIEMATPERDGVMPVKGALKLTSKFVETVSQEAVFSSPNKSPVVRAGAPNRPTTSRGKARPSPEEFFDYVVPSPDRNAALDFVPSTLRFEPDAPEIQQSPNSPQAKATSSQLQQPSLSQPLFGKPDAMPRRINAPALELDDSDSDNSDSPSNTDQSSISQQEQSDQLIALGCFLFGSAIAV